LIERFLEVRHSVFRKMRVVLAILMVVLIGNPVCCCVFAHSGPIAVEMPSCCQDRLSAMSASDPLEEEEVPTPACPCSKKIGIVSPDKAYLPVPLIQTWFPTIPVEIDFASLVPRLPDFQGKAVPPPASLLSESPPPRLLYGVFRC